MAGGKGSCACGRTTYTFSGDPVGAVVCHCLSCKKLTGSPFASVLLIPSLNFEFTSNSPVKSTTIKHHVEDIDMTPSFCGNCGSLVCKTADDERFRGLHIVFRGTMDEGAENMKPQQELWTKYRGQWVQPLEGAVQCRTFEE